MFLSLLRPIRFYFTANIRINFNSVKMFYHASNTKLTLVKLYVNDLVMKRHSKQLQKVSNGEVLYTVIRDVHNVFYLLIRNKNNFPFLTQPLLKCVKYMRDYYHYHNKDLKNMFDLLGKMRLFRTTVYKFFSDSVDSKNFQETYSMSTFDIFLHCSITLYFLKSSNTCIPEMDI